MDLNQFSTVDIVLDKANDNIIQKQTISAGDRDGRSLTLQVTDAGSIGEVPGLTANLLWTNHSSGLSDLSAFSVVDRLTSVFKIIYPQNMLTAGKVTAQIQLLHNGKVTHSKKFEIIVLDIAGKLKGVLQSAEYTALVEALAKTNGFETDIAEVSAQLAQKATYTYVNDKVESVVDWSPKGTFDTVSELESTYPNGTEGIYLVTTNGRAYNWNGAWVDLGQYKGDNFSGRIPLTWNLSKRITSAGEIINDPENRNDYTNSFLLTKGQRIYINAVTYANSALLSRWTKNGGLIEVIKLGDGTTGYEYTATQDKEYLRINNNNVVIPREQVYVEIKSIQSQALSHILDNLGTIENGQSVDLIMTTPRFIGTNGNIVDGSSRYETSDIFTVAKGDIIAIFATAYSGVSVLSEWDSSGVFLRNIITGEETATNTAKLPYIYEVKKEVEFLRVTNVIPNNPNVSVRKINDSLLGVKNRVEVVENKLNLNKSPNPIPNPTRKPVITFIFDDGGSRDTQIKDLFDSVGFKCGFALLSGDSSTSRYLSYQDMGYEILSHSITHTNMSGTGMSIDDAVKEFKNSKEALESKGYNIRAWVQPNSQLNKIYLPYLKKYYELAYTNYLGLWTTDTPQLAGNLLSEDSREYKRVSMEETSVENCKLAIDNTIANTSFTTFYGHSYNLGGSLTIAEIEEVLNYAKTYVDSGECLVLTPSECYDHYCTLRHSDFVGVI